MVTDVLKMYEFFRTKNIQTEIVILDEEKHSYENYVKEGMKTIFNIDIDQFNDENNYEVWKYITDAKAFIQ